MAIENQYNNKNKFVRLYAGLLVITAMIILF